MLTTAPEPARLAAVLAAGLAAGWVVWLLVPSQPRVAPPATSDRRRRHAWWLLVVPAIAVTGAGPQASVITLIAVAAGWSGLLLVRRGSRRRDAARRGAQVRECCDLLASELSVGLPPGAALARAAAAWPELAPVARAFSLGGDVPAAWQTMGHGGGGGGDLRVVAAAWHVAHRTGDGLAAAMTRVAGELRRTEATRRVVAAELASARATARLLAGLPLVALAMGTGVGGSPWAFLFGTPLGLACLGAGLALGLAGLWWIEAIADGVSRGLSAGDGRPGGGPATGSRARAGRQR